MILITTGKTAHERGPHVPLLNGLPSAQSKSNESAVLKTHLTVNIEKQCDRQTMNLREQEIHRRLHFHL